MNYCKPQATVLGDAAHLIQGSKQPAGDSGSMEFPIAEDCELND